jgi:spore germination protein
MKISLPIKRFKRKTKNSILLLNEHIETAVNRKKTSPIELLWSFITYMLAFACLMLIFVTGTPRIERTISPLVTALHPLKEAKKGYQVYGYAPYWTIDNMASVDFSSLTTLAYFGVPVESNGDLSKDDPGYNTFISDKATSMFQRAHDAGAKVNLTVTQMDNYSIETFLDNPSAQSNAINQIVSEVQNRGIDGVSVDFEYTGNPGSDYQNKFTGFVNNLSNRIHTQIPHSQVTVAVYALAAHDPQLYNIGELSKSADQIFMMAYDFAAAGSDIAAPTAPLYGYKNGKYSYDISTAVEDFTKIMPSNKLILGVPYYGYNYPVYEPKVNGQTYPYYNGTVQTYAKAQEQIQPTSVTNYTAGWDDDAEVGWKAYTDPDTGAWRMIFTEDSKSLGIKYDFAKNKNLAGVGIWALGFDNGHSELWALLKDKFGEKIADTRGLLYK